ncbi:MAG TPA: peptidyl-prolyl cis-trans isomerase [Thermoanaerobaculaceae bacterium]|nr:peptidyl-prolyl cis-trans isomerase [Thermoanaerobaculaceae bacterium]HRS16353.1 peptidyl-prolyl cis-trans isomerase [Thermoanaerobaculaceae bacterium]
MRALVVLTFLAFLCNPLAAAERVLVEGIVVRVNDRIFTTRDVARRIDERAGELGRPLTAEDLEALLTQITEDACLLERANELKINVDDQEVDGALQRLREQNQVLDERAFEESLRNMGMTREQLRARVRENIVINRLLSREVRRPAVTEEELKRRYASEIDRYRLPERVHLEHAILPVGKDAGDEERALASARRLAAAARTTGDFLAVVKEEVEAGRATGGDLGLVAVPDLRREVAQAVAGLKPGEVSEPFRSPSGVHVVRLRARLEPGVRPFAEVAEELRFREEEERYRSHITQIVEGLRTRYVIEVHPELVALPSK